MAVSSTSFSAVSAREFLRFLEIALGSAGELQDQLNAAIDCSAIAQDEGSDLAQRAEEVAKMIQGLIRRIKTDLNYVANKKAANS